MHYSYKNARSQVWKLCCLRARAHASATHMRAWCRTARVCTIGRANASAPCLCHHDGICHAVPCYGRGRWAAARHLGPARPPHRRARTVRRGPCTCSPLSLPSVLPASCTHVLPPSCTTYLLYYLPRMLSPVLLYSLLYLS